MDHPSIRPIEQGTPQHLGAHADGGGVNFALHSKHAQKVELCLFDDSGAHEIRRIELPARSGDVFHGYVPDLKPGQIYGYRVHGPQDPAQGHRFNPQKLLLDPYAQELVGTVHWNEALQDPTQDSAPSMIKARVPAALPPLQYPQPKIPKSKTVIMEMHPKGMTMLDAKIPADKRGTYAGLAAPETIQYLKDMGITTVELLPVASKMADDRLENLGLANYWGYDTIAPFAPEKSYARDPNNARAEFRDMVECFHAAKIEIILDVVFNHTAEGPAHAPALSLRGIDNAEYYRLQPQDKTRYVDETGCGNTLDLSKPAVRRMVLDCLRHWVETYGVDGFRFDLAPVLGRDPDAFNTQAAFFREVAADPVLSNIKLIAEPWDIGMGGYQLGNFPAGWQEWNDTFRDDVRKFWLRPEGTAGALATRLAGSAPQFDTPQRRPQDSVNMITCHDGFTLHDTVSYNHKHNDANGEQNRDGNNTNHSHNNGAEGDTTDTAIHAQREKQKRNMLTTLFMAQGTPMILAGDEHGNSQRGNNNAYCQDNKTGWIDKDTLTPDGKDLQNFTRALVAFRQAHPALSAEKFLHGADGGDGRRDIAWLTTQGNPMQPKDWSQADCFAMLLDEDKIETPHKPDTGRRLMAVFNKSAAPQSIQFPTHDENGIWERMIDTAAPKRLPTAHNDGASARVAPQSVAVFVRKPRTP